MNRLKSGSLRLVTLLLAMLAVAGMCQVGWAQIASSINGRVEDASGAAVPGANVTVTSLETGIARSAATDESGNYRILSLQVGRYEVKAEKTGFKSEVQTGINLLVAQQAVVNLKLTVGALQEQVTVTSDAPLVNTTTSSVAGLVGEQQVKDLPLNGRSFDLLITLNAASLDYSGYGRGGAQGSGDHLFSVAGRRASSTLTLMNGVEYPGASNASVAPSGTLLGVDAVREYNVVSDTYGAEYGKKGGAQVNVVTQSGTNQLHGGLFHFMRNSFLDARNFYDAAVVPPFQKNQFGGALGGPIRKDKTFVFGNYEGVRQVLAGSGSIFVPDSNLRKGLLPCGGGSTFPVCAAGAAVGTPTAVAGTDPRMLTLINGIYPEANGPTLGGGVAQFFGQSKAYSQTNFYTGRFDQIFSTKDSASAVYMINTVGTQSTAQNLTTRSIGGGRIQIGSVQETHIFSPNVVNTVTAGFSRTSDAGDTIILVKFPPNLLCVIGETACTISIGGSGNVSQSTSLTSQGGGSAQQTFFNRTLFTYSDGVQVVKGKHQITAGAWFQRIQANEYDPLRSAGQATFANLTTMLQGQVMSFTIAPQTTEMGWRTWLGAWYVQDSIQLRPHLTMRIGFRHEFSNGWHEHTGRAETYLFDSNGVIQTMPRISSQYLINNNSKWLLSPRIALAWDVFGNGKTAIRAAGGIYYDMVDTLSYFADVTPPLSGALALSNVNLFSVIPIDRSAPIPPPCGPAIVGACNIYSPKGVDPNLKVPTIDSWNFTLEQQLTRQTGLRMTYMGTHSYHQFFNTDPNSIPAQVCANAAGCIAGGVAAAANRTLVSQGTRYIPVSSKPNPYLDYGLFLWTQGSGTYHGLSTELIQRLTKGLQFRGSYTWSHNLDSGSAVIGTVSRNDSPHYNTNQGISNKGPAGFDVRHLATTSFSYDLPFGQGKALLGGARGVVDQVVGGWQLNAILSMVSGFPISPLAGSNRSGSGDQNNPDRPNIAPGASGNPVDGVTGTCAPTIIKPGQQLQTADRWFDPCAFTLPPVGTFGNAGRGIVRGPRTAQLQLSLFKNARITERIRLQFRAEAFNTLNRTNLGQPNSTGMFSGTAYNPQAGKSSFTSTTARQLQLGLKLVF